MILYVGLLGGLATGCASAPPSQSDPISKATVLGTWEYQADGIPELSRGMFRITSQEDRLRAHVRDEKRGTLVGRVHLNGSHLEITLHDLHITGHIQDETFTATLHRSFGDVSTPAHVRRSSETGSASFVARRITSRRGFAPLPALDCPSILWETDHGCHDEPL